MVERDLTVGRDQERKAQDPKVVPPVLAVASLRQLGSAVEAVEEGEEVGGVKQEAPQVQAETRDGQARKILFDSGDLFRRNALHVVPEALARQLSGREGQ